MSPYYEKDGITIYNGDCREIIPQLPPVDAVLTDPPFGVRDEDWDRMDEHEFCRFSMEWLSLVRKACDTLVSFYASGSRFADICELIYPRVRQLIWFKPPGSQYAGSSEAKLWFAYEPIAHCYEPSSWEVCKPKFLDVANCIKSARMAAGLSRGAVDMAIRGKRTGLCYRWEEAACLPTPEQVRTLKSLLRLNGEFEAAMVKAVEDRDDTLEKAAEKAAEKADVLAHRTVIGGLHPCEKPIGLIYDLLDTVACDAEVILDPFMGSGTTLRAAKDFGKRAIGIEQNEEYCETAVERLRQGVLPLTA